MKLKLQHLFFREIKINNYKLIFPSNLGGEDNKVSEMEAKLRQMQEEMKKMQEQLSAAKNSQQQQPKKTLEEIDVFQVHNLILMMDRVPQRP